MIVLQEGLRVLEFITRALLHILPYFLLAGPVTAIPAMIAVFGLVNRKVFLLFLLLGLSLSIILGYLYEFISLI